jgi:polyhydroxyalkanoate synthase
MMTSSPVEPTADSATASAVGGDLLSGYDPLQLAEALAATIQPADLVSAGRNIATGWLQVLLGSSDIALPPKDFRFKDPAWTENPVYHRLAQGYLLFAEEMMRLVEGDRGDWRTAERSRFAMTAITTALSPSNTVLNPAALKRYLETAGGSGLRGLRNFVGDLRHNRGLPAQVDMSAFVVGETLAATPGAVVHREEMFEILQYAPTTEEVSELPLLLLPPPVNKYYFWDLAPGRSMIEFAVAQGISVFTMVWRDPRPGQGGLGIDDYVLAQMRALEVVLDVSGAGKANVFGDCSGGLFESLMLGYLAADGDERIRSATFGVTVLDFGHPSAVAMTASQRTLKDAERKAAAGEVIPAGDISSTFVWMRPNDLVWRYLINNWLLGNDPPAFDVLFWNNDGQALPSRLACDLGKITLENSVGRPGGVTVLGRPIDLTAVKCDAYLIAGSTDHISPWKACYAATQMFGGSCDFILTSTGHVQSIINPPGNPRASFHTGGELGPDPDAWLASATKHTDSWWPHWTAWLGARSGEKRPAPAELGNDKHPVLGPAPGRYVLGE